MDSTIPAVALAEDSFTRTVLDRVDEEFFHVLESAVEEIKQGKIVSAFRRLHAPLSAIWSKARAADLAESIRYECHNHHLFSLVQQDPFTNRAATKPRGYAGDAELLDYMYQCIPPERAGELGKAIFRCTTSASTSLSVRFRRQLLRSLIDDVVSSTPEARVLSIASGHARELEGSLVMTPVFDGEFVAIDQDPLSCAEVERSQAGNHVRAMQMNVIEFLKSDRQRFGEFDLIYSAGLFDYLSDGLARRLTRRMLQMLRPGGRLLIANFVPDTAARAYMEIFMDWNLIFRSESEICNLVQAAGATQLRSFLDPHRNVVYVEMTRERAD